MLTDFFQAGCLMAYDEITSELLTRYDVYKEISNANQKLKQQTGDVQITIPAASYVSRVVVTWDLTANPLQFTVGSISDSGLSAVVDISPELTIGTTEAGEDIFTGKTSYQRVIWVNKYFDAETILYFSITGGFVNIDLACNTTNLSPVMSIVEDSATESYTLTIPANTYLYKIFPLIVLDEPVISIGTTDGGEEIVAETIISDVDLVIEDGMNYFDTETLLYVTLTGGSADIRYELGYNYIEHLVQYARPRNSLFVKLTIILAIRNILGSTAGENTILRSHFDWAEKTIDKIKSRQMSLTLEGAPSSITSRGSVVESSFKTIG
jgi:hypothetical protein